MTKHFIENGWYIFLNFGIISTALLTATGLNVLIRKKLNRLLIPTALIAGFLLLPFYIFFFDDMGLTQATLTDITYHFLALSFIALALKRSKRHKSTGKSSYKMAIAIFSQYAFQATLGLLLTYIMIKTFMPELYHSFGYSLPLGFAMGPGQASQIMDSWKEVGGIEGAGNIGLTMGALGFILCSFLGLILLNRGAKKGWISSEELEYINKTKQGYGVYPRDAKRPVGSYNSTESDTMDSVSLHIALVMFIYILTWLFLTGITALLKLIGPMGEELAASLWGIHFIFAVLITMIVKVILKAAKVEYITDNLTLNRISGSFVDYMIASAIAAINIKFVSQYWLPILILAGVGVTMIYISVIFMASRMFTDHRYLRTLLLFGISTGTISTGMALLRTADPEFESPVVEDYTYGSGIVFMLAIPLIISINLPVKAFATGDERYFWAAFGICCAYSVFIIINYIAFAGKRAFKKGNGLWY
jgi:ESS family glutamate:Na+ symporter